MTFRPSPAHRLMAALPIFAAFIAACPSPDDTCNSIEVPILDGTFMAPAMAPDGDTVAVRNLVFNDDGELSRIAPDGTVRWRVPLGAKGSDPVIAPDGRIHLVAGGLLRTHEADGALAWVARGERFVALAADRTLITGGFAPGDILRYAPDGALLARAAVAVPTRKSGASQSAATGPSLLLNAMPRAAGKRSCWHCLRPLR